MWISTDIYQQVQEERPQHILIYFEVRAFVCGTLFPTCGSSSNSPADSSSSCGCSSACCWAWLPPETTLDTVSWGPSPPLRSSQLGGAGAPGPAEAVPLWRQTINALRPTCCLVLQPLHICSHSWRQFEDTRVERTHISGEKKVDVRGGLGEKKQLWGQRINSATCSLTAGGLMASHGTARDEMDGYNSSKKKNFLISIVQCLLLYYGWEWNVIFFSHGWFFGFWKKLNLYKNILNYIVTLGGPLNCVWRNTWQL